MPLSSVQLKLIVKTDSGYDEYFHKTSVRQTAPSKVSKMKFKKEFNKGDKKKTF